MIYTVAFVFISFIYPFAVGYYGAERGLKLGESLVLGLLPMAIVVMITSLP